MLLLFEELLLVGLLLFLLHFRGGLVEVFCGSRGVPGRLARRLRGGERRRWRLLRAVLRFHWDGLRVRRVCLRQRFVDQVEDALRDLRLLGLRLLRRAEAGRAGESEHRVRRP